MILFCNSNFVDRIFIHGIPLCIKQLYPVIEFPVSRGTPMIAPLIKWDHSTEWSLPEESQNDISSERKVVVNVSDKDSDYMKGHIIDGKMRQFVEVNCLQSSQRNVSSST